MASILFLIADGQFDQVVGQAEILSTAFIMKPAQPCANDLLVTVAVPVNAAVFGRMRRKIGDRVERGIGVFSKLLHVLVKCGFQMAGERYPSILDFPVCRNVPGFVDMQDALEQWQEIGARHGLTPFSSFDLTIFFSICYFNGQTTTVSRIIFRASLIAQGARPLRAWRPCARRNLAILP